MAKVDELARLFQAIAAQDLRAAELTAARIAEGEARLGHHSAARLLRGSLHPNARRGSTNGGQAAQNIPAASLLTEALTLVTAPVPLKQLELKPGVRAEFQSLGLEWNHRAGLQAANLPRRSRALFHGPPGCGKSAAAAGLASALGLPCYVVRFDAVVGAYLGQTALHLRELFRFTETTPCVLLMDELDAIGKQRGDSQDVGELHRIVITLLQEFEHTRPAGYVIATSNLPTQLDKALWRRFDVVIEFARPSPADLARYGRARAKRLNVALTSKLRGAINRAASYAEAERLLLSEARQSVLLRLESVKHGHG